MAALILTHFLNYSTPSSSLMLLQWTADGPCSVLVRKLVVAGLSPELAATLCLRMAARIAKATRPKRATRKRVQVWIAGDEWVLTVVVYMV